MLIKGLLAVLLLCTSSTFASETTSIAKALKRASAYEDQEEAYWDNLRLKGPGTRKVVLDDSRKPSDVDLKLRPAKKKKIRK